MKLDLETLPYLSSLAYLPLPPTTDPNCRSIWQTLAKEYVWLFQCNIHSIPFTHSASLSLSLEIQHFPISYCLVSDWFPTRFYRNYILSSNIANIHPHTPRAREYSGVCVHGHVHVFDITKYISTQFLCRISSASAYHRSHKVSVSLFVLYNNNILSAILPPPFPQNFPC